MELKLRPVATAILSARMTRHVAYTWQLPGHVQSKHDVVERRSNEPELK